MATAPIVQDIQKTLQQLETTLTQLENFITILGMVDEDPQNLAKDFLGYAKAYVCESISDVSSAIHTLSVKD